ncbi:MAG: dockerin type I domain-containing protein [Planctomycetota bacterium]
MLRLDTKLVGVVALFVHAGSALGQTRSVTATSTQSAVTGVPQSSVVGAGPTYGEPTTVFFEAPTKDTSTYSNIGATGNSRDFVWASTFPGEGRQSSLVAMFDTATAGLPTGVDARRVWFESITFTAATWLSSTAPQAKYDPSPDAWETQLWAGGDITVFNEFGGITPVDSVFVPAEPRYQTQGAAEDDNAPLELFGVRFNNGLSAATWNESSSGTTAWSNGIPNAEPVDFPGGVERSVQSSFGESGVEFAFGLYDAPDGQTYDTFFPTGNFVANPVDGFDPEPLAYGLSYDVAAGTPGETVAGQTALGQNDLIPFGHRFRFEVDTRRGPVIEYFRDQLEIGWVSLIMSQAAFGDLAVAEYSYWITKDGKALLDTLDIDFDASTLEITYVVPLPGDVDGSGAVEVSDLVWVIRGVGEPGVHQTAFPQQDSAATLDVNADGYVDAFDVFAVVGMLR